MSDQNFRWIVVVLLVANTFLVCALAGAGFVYLRNDPAAAAARMPLAGEQLPKTEREAFRRSLSDARRTMRETSAEARRARIEAASLMGQKRLTRRHCPQRLSVPARRNMRSAPQPRCRPWSSPAHCR